MKKQLVIHPFLFAIYPVLFLYSINVWQTTPPVILRPLTIVLGTTALTWLLLRYLLKDNLKAAMMTSITLLLFFSYGHVHDALLNRGLMIGKNRFLLPSWGVLFLWGSFLVLRARRHLSMVTRALNIVAATLIVLTLFSIGEWAFTKMKPLEIRVEAESIELTMPDDPPDIYYIVLDGYMRSDILKEVLGHDNSEFTDYLENRGFYVASESRSNYPYTMLSLASSLNMEYVNFLSDTVGTASRDVTATYPLIQANSVGELLQSIGYRYVQVGTLWPATNYSGIADEILTWRDIGQEEQFFSLLAETTVLQPLLRERRDDDRQAILFAFDRIAQQGNREQPTLVFAHIVSPHPPYVFGTYGEPVGQPEGGWTPEGTQHAYLNQLLFINHKLEELITKLLAQSEVAPIIVLQSDHGWAWAVGWDLYPKIAPDEVFDLEQVFGILNAYYLPDDGDEGLYSSISPVNSFRLIFNTYFGANLDLHPDESYFSDYYKAPYRFNNVTEELDS
ncbi:sulfatase-like hydrolase/transferase [Patescibacteria group bacterium]|nr:sulfatase-like hydrolase/transferase [Patescibacteria group bacterium]